MAQPAGARLSNRWVQLAAAMLCQVVVGDLQWTWTLFVAPIDAAHHWGTTAIQIGFTVLVLTQAWLMPVAAYGADRLGPSRMMLLGGLLAAAAWTTSAAADSLPVLYAGQALGGLSFAVVSGSATGTALRWFSDRRGLAVGLTSGAFACGSVLTAVPIASMIQSSGYEATFARFGLLHGVLLVLVATVLRSPRGAPLAGPTPIRVPQTQRDLSPREMVRTPIFYVLYGMFTMISMGGLVITAELSTLATDFRVSEAPVTLAGLSLATLPLALSMNRILDGVGRPFFGAISDRIGRENTMFVAFVVEAVMTAALLTLGTAPWLFVLLSGLVLFAFGEIYTLFPAISADLFGRRFAATNWGALWTAKGTASLLVPLASFFAVRTGSWSTVFLVAVALDVIAAVVALAVLKPLRARMLAPEQTTLEMPEVVVMPTSGYRRLQGVD